ncbi:hypothetical protein [Lacisediminihabitans sp. H27-G8]|uniref:hypothetical protein n=1 Tax=Lacisediminihabitans sp. H27-G8 TaxID=3111909 RepID=UPI0038FC5FB8
MSVLTVAGHRFRLAANVDLGLLAEQIEHAAQAGGEMVTVPIASTESVMVLVSPGISVVLHIPPTGEVSSEFFDGEETNGTLINSDGAVWNIADFELGALS